MLDKIYIYGAGNWGNIYYQYCVMNNIDVAGFITTDGTAAVKNNNVEIYSLADYIAEKKIGHIVIAMRYADDVYANLTRLGISDIEILTQSKIQTIIEEIGKVWISSYNEDIYKKTISIGGVVMPNPLLQDDKYYFEWFMGIVDVILPSECGIDEFVNEGSYEYNQVKLDGGDVVCDLGGGIGEFTCLALKRGCEVHSFEPSIRNYKYLQLVRDITEIDDKLHLVKSAVTERTASEEFYSGGTTLGYDGFRRVEDLVESYDVDTISLDEYVQENGIARVDFIKANIEGSERRMLEGARETIRYFKPKLSLRTNHYPDDPKVLESIILDINPEYKIIHKWRNIYAYCEA